MIEEFLTPTTIEEAISLKNEREDAAYLAGGTEVNSADYAFTVRRLVSLAALDLAGIRTTDTGWSIGACTTLQQILEHTGLPSILLEACNNVHNRNIRNQATLGGHIAANKSCADVIPALFALNANIVRINGLITVIHIPSQPGRRLAIENFSRTANDVSLLNAAVGYDYDDAVIQNPVVALGGVAAHVVRLPAIEERLAGSPLPDSSDLENWVHAAVSPIDDMRGTAEFKRHLAGVLVSRAMRRAGA